MDIDPAALLAYLAEGAANIVYRYRGPPRPPPDIQRSAADLHADFDAAPSARSQTPPPTEVEPEDSEPEHAPWPLLGGRPALLRLHKDVDWFPGGYAALHAQFQRLIAPLFEPDQVVVQELAAVAPELVLACNQALSKAQDGPQSGGQVVHAKQRPAKRHGLMLAQDDPHGLLLQDMSPAEGQILLELKPKWLAQSPSAPKTATRCRTCALRAMRTAKTAGGHFTSPAQGFCPLELVSGKTAGPSPQILELVSALLAQQGVTADATLVQAITASLTGAPLLARLKALQQKLDPIGVLAIKEADEPFLVATTLRDCTLFVRVTPTAGAPTIEHRLGDLDLKSGTGKLAYWQATEESLVEEGWYEARDGGVAGCVLGG